jgi:hypothetical protein
MNIGRYAHSSCAVGFKVYVFGGILIDDKMGKTPLGDCIEFIDLEPKKDKDGKDIKAIWNLIEITSMINPRNRVNLACGVYGDMIVIFGGHMKNANP